MNSISTTAVDTSCRSPASKPRAEPIKGYPVSLLQIYWLGFFTINPKSRKSQSNVSKKTIFGLALTTARSSCNLDQAFLSCQLNPSLFKLNHTEKNIKLLG
ncbi:hypothetical protein E1A91_D12G103800v1 [Gossypium mustelinum]|uniref:Uncharacterized protein n=2 Tax=Gossypium TaxID=3633 RepID=A0A5D2SCD6_GOSMU|nr:hypothetical protein E1A91_D12G103800v1 [Gossypium mustelinum]